MAPLCVLIMVLTPKAIQSSRLLSSQLGKVLFTLTQWQLFQEHFQACQLLFKHFSDQASQYHQHHLRAALMPRMLLVSLFKHISNSNQIRLNLARPPIQPHQIHANPAQANPTHANYNLARSHRVTRRPHPCLKRMHGYNETCGTMTLANGS